MKDRSATIFLGVLLAGFAILCALIARPFLGPLILASLLAVGFYPLHATAVKWVRWPNLAAVLSTLAILLAVLLPLALLAVTVGGEIAEQYGKLKTASEENGGMASYLHGVLRDSISWVAPRINMSEEDLTRAAAERLSAALKWTAQAFAFGLLAAGSWIVDAVLASVILFFFLRDGPLILETIVDLVPLRREDSAELIRVIDCTIRANLNGVIGVAIVQGALTGIGLAIAGIPSPFTWGLVAAFCSMLPVFGSGLVWVPAALWLLATGSYGLFVFLVVWGVMVGASDNILRPLVVGGQTNQNTLLVFLSLIGGTSAFGLLGLFLGPLVVSVTVAVVKVFRRKVSAGHTSP